jgi:lipopolysaccharide transport system ATP-binding protein
LDTPVKRYSSGMYMRLAFAVSAHLEPDVLLVDEVLAVGDAVFQRKCIGKMNSVAREGRTVLFVSHNMAPVVQLCDTAIWLDTGSIVQQGPTRDVVSLYMTSDASTEGECRWPGGIADPGVEDFKFLSVRALNHRGEVSGTIDASHPMSIEIEYEILRELPYCRVGFWFSNVDGVVIFEAHDADFDERLAGTRPPGRYVARCEIPANTLVPVRYIISVNAGMPPMRRLARVEGALTLDVDTSAGTSIKRFYGLIRPPLFWDTEVNEGVAAS